MESATFKFNGRQISLNVDKATPNLVVRLLKVPGSKFALTSEEGNCVEPKGQEYFSEKLEPGSTYTVLDLNNEPACPRSQSSVQEVTFVHEDESGRKLLWKTNPQGLAFGQIARHYCLDPETMIVLDSEGTPFENSSSLQLQSGMEYQVHGSPVPNDQPSDADYDAIMSAHGEVDGEKYWTNLASVVNIVGIVEVLNSIRLSLHTDIDMKQEYSFDGFKEKSARRALYDLSANIQDVYTFTRKKMNEMGKCLNEISEIVTDSMNCIMKFEPSSKIRETFFNRHKADLEKAGNKCETIAGEIVAEMSKTITRINQLASCLAAESATEKRVNKAKIEKEENVEKQEALSQERERVAEQQKQSQAVLKRLLDDYKEKSSKLNSWGLTLFGWWSNPEQVESPSEMEEELFLRFVKHQFVNPLPELEQLLSKKEEIINDFEHLDSLSATSSLKTAVDSFVKILKNVTDKESYEQLKKQEQQMKIQYETDRNAKDQRDNLRKRGNDAKTMSEKVAVEADVAKEDYHSALNMYEKNETCIKEALSNLSDFQHKLRQLDRDLEYEDLVRCLRQCSSHLETTKGIMNQQVDVFSHVHNIIEIGFKRRIDFFCFCLTATANVEHLKEAEELNRKLYRDIFKVGSFLLALKRYTRVYAKIDEKYIMEPMTEVLKRSAQLSLDPNPQPVSFTNPDTTSVHKDIQEELQAIRNEVAEQMSPFTNNF